jgi:(p)ppGpp synthase/HD superfamily hydrolase
MSRDWDLVRAATELAITANENEYRKGTDIPYLSHLLAVTAIVYEHGGDDEQVAAALLHDMAEDQGGEDTLRLIHETLPGHPRVAEMVRSLSDAIVDDRSSKPPWEERKVGYLRHLQYESPAVLLISAADKLHNCRAILDDYRAIGEQLWSRFNAGRPEVLWYYDELARIFSERLPGRLSDELHRTIDQLRLEVAIHAPTTDVEVEQVRSRLMLS